MGAGFISSCGGNIEGGQGGAGDSFVKLIVNLSNITPTTETINNKEYKKFTFSKTNLSIKTVTPLGDEETLAVDDALIYNLLPISNNNDDKGVNISYDGNTFVGYVLAQESTLTTVTFMFTYYIILSQTSVVWKNYVDMVGGGSESDINGLNVINATLNYGVHRSFKNITSWQNASSYNAYYTDANSQTWNFSANRYSVNEYISSSGGLVFSDSAFSFSHTDSVDFARVVLTRTGGTSSSSNPQVSFKCECYSNNEIVNTITKTTIFTGSNNYVFDIFNEKYDKIVISPYEGLSLITNPKVRIETTLGIFSNNTYSLICENLENKALVFCVPYTYSTLTLVSINDLPFINSGIILSDLSNKCFLGFFDASKQIFKKAELT